MIHINILKPLHGTFCYIREDTIINRAILLREKVKVTLPQGSAVIDPAEWKKTGKRLEKVFKFEGRPMILWGNYLDIPNKAQQKLL